MDVDSRGQFETDSTCALGRTILHSAERYLPNNFFFAAASSFSFPSSTFG
jgi:hypothetical protein